MRILSFEWILVVVNFLLGITSSSKHIRNQQLCNWRITGSVPVAYRFGGPDQTTQQGVELFVI